MRKDILTTKIEKWEDLPYNSLVIIKKVNYYCFGFVINHEGEKAIGNSSLEYGSRGKYGGEFYSINGGYNDVDVVAYYRTTFSLPHPDRWNENFFISESEPRFLISKLNRNESFRKEGFIYFNNIEKD